MTKLRHSAFSLIELIVVLLMMGTVGSVVIACFMGGVRAYERARDFGSGEADAALALDVMERDLKNAVMVPGLPFEGDLLKMRFATIATESEATSGDRISVAVVQYGERMGDGIVRLVEIPGESPVEIDVGDSLLSGNVAMRLAYYGSGDGRGEAGWVESWQSESNLPRQVRVRLSGGELATAVLERTIIVPVAEGDAEKGP